MVLGLLVACGCSGGGIGQGQSTRAASATVELPQSVAGALWANPAVYAQVPLRVTTSASASSVKVSLNGQQISAANVGGNHWVAQLPIANLADGIVPVSVSAAMADGSTASASADLGIGRQGVKLTDFNQVGPAGTAQLRTIGDKLMVTWTDWSSGTSQGYMRQIDGAGRFVGNRVPLITSPDKTLYVRTAVGASSIGVLYQRPGGPYSNFFQRVAPDGTALGGPVALDPASTFGSFGGDVTFDGSGFVAVWRSNNGMAQDTVFWARFDEATGHVTGPVAVATAGPGNPDGGFEPFSYVKVQTIGTISVVSFVRGHWSDEADFDLDKSQQVVVTQQGQVAQSNFLGSATALTADLTTRTFVVGGQFLSLWTEQDLTSSDDNPPTQILVRRADGGGRMIGQPQVMVNAPDTRDEMFLLAHPDKFAVMAWVDGRSESPDPSMGALQLYLAPVGNSLSVGAPVIFTHARFVESTSELNGTLAGSNVMLVWIDERDGQGVANPKPEVFFETAWF
jgi:hypothetical protein